MPTHPTNPKDGAKPVPKIALSDAGLRSLQAPAMGTVDYWDSSFKAGLFGARISQGGAISFILKIDNSRRKIGRYPTISLAQARTEAKNLLAERTLGRIRPQSITFEQALKLFLEEKGERRRARTVEDHKRHLELLGFKGQVGDITHDDMDRKLKKLPPSEFNHRLSCAKTFFNWCVKRRYRTDNPALAFSMHTLKSRERILTTDELKKVWKATGRLGSYGTVVQLLILLGQRETETASIRAEWIDFGEKTLTIPGEVTKNHNETVIPLGPLAIAILEKQKKTGLLFPARGKPDQPINGWSKSKAALDALTKIEHHTLHDLRRTFRSGLGQLGVAPHIAERLVNHVSAQTQMERIYDRYKYLPEMRAAIELWEGHLLKQRVVQ